MRIDKQKIKELKHEVEVYDEVIKSCRAVLDTTEINTIQTMSAEANNQFKKSFDLDPVNDADTNNIHKLFSYLADEMINRLEDEKTEKKVELEVLENMPKASSHSWQKAEVSPDLQAKRLMDKIPSDTLSEIKNKLQEESEFPALQRGEVKQIINKATGETINNKVLDKIIDTLDIEPQKGSDLTKG